MLPFQCLDGDPLLKPPFQRDFLKEGLGQGVTTLKSLVYSHPASTGVLLSVRQLVHK